MAVQTAINNSTVPFIRSGETVVREAATVSQDAGRTTPLVFGTLMAKKTADGEWVPFTNAAATDGTAIPRGFYLGDEISAASLVAGDVTDVPILVGGGAATLDRDQIVIENSLTLGTVIGSGVASYTVEDAINSVGLFPEFTVDIDEFENA